MGSNNYDEKQDNDFQHALPEESDMQEFDMQDLDYVDDDSLEEDEFEQDQVREKDGPKKGMGIAAMIFGIFSVLLFCIPVAGQILALTALILGIVAVVKNKGRKQGISGIIMGAVSLIAVLMIAVGFGGLFHRSNVDEDTLSNAAWRRADDGSVLYLYEDGTFIHVDQEGVFTDNFFSGTYVILSYDDTNLSFTGLERQYDMDYAYDVYLYVDQYVTNGEESENIAGTIRYLYLFDREYSKGDAVHLCAHDSGSYGNPTPVVETELQKPTIGNCYEPVELAAEPEDDGDDAEATEMTTETEVTEGTSDESGRDAGTTEAEVTEGSTEESSIEQEVSSALDEASSEMEDIQQEVSSAAENANEMLEDVSNHVDVNQLVQSIKNFMQQILDIFSKWL